MDKEKKTWKTAKKTPGLNKTWKNEHMEKK